MNDATPKVEEMGGWESGSWSKRQRIVSIAAAPPHPSTPPAELGPSVITHSKKKKKKFKRLLSSRLRALESDWGQIPYFETHSALWAIKLPSCMLHLQSKFFFLYFYVLIGEKKREGFFHGGWGSTGGKTRQEGIGNRKVWHQKYANKNASF